MKHFRFLGDLNGTNLRRDETGLYRWPVTEGADAVEYMSVTSIISILNKPGLQRWHASMERDHLLKRMEAVYRGELKGRALLEELKGKNWKPHAESFRNERAGLGSAVHHAVTLYVLARESDTPAGVEDVEEGVRPFLRSFHKWFEAECPSYLFVEGPVFNQAERYAGTSDALIQFRDGAFIVDYKISPRPDRDHCLQLAAYRHADFIGVRYTGQEIPLPKTDGGYILLIHADGCHLHPMQCGEREFEVFRQAQSIHRWRNEEFEAPKEAW